MQQYLTEIICRLTSNQRKFVVEIIGTFIVVVLATGSIVKYHMTDQSKRLGLKEHKVAGKAESLESSDPCCLPGCCNNSSGGGK